MNSPTSTPTEAPPTSVPTVSPSVVAACFGPNVAPSQVTLVGDLLYTSITPGGLDYPAAMLPEGTPLTQPYKMTTNSLGNAGYATDFPNSPATNPSLNNQGGGFQFSVCNIAATASHILRGVSAKIATLTPYTGQLSQWNRCDGSIDSHHQPTGTGCGGATAGCVCFHATFPDGAAGGATVEMTQTDDSVNGPGDHTGRFPLTLAPGKAIGLNLTLDPLKAPAQYTFTFGLTVDSAALTFLPSTSPAALLAPVAHKWSGQACLSQPALLAQITPTNPETYYICGQ